ncbi:hypothetical protein PLICRDRAFT_40085 [Plicaturopsis crispa FD-325 SS-3]|nr:hypothetical protein PLICRDRAFT_40085 [Plicaturopsis crispa FD-325 SS-3]
MVAYKKGDVVQYHPIGGASDNVSSSTGEIVDVEEVDGELKYSIKNDNTGKTTTYQAKNVVGLASK